MQGVVVVVVVVGPGKLGLGMAGCMIGYRWIGSGEMQ